MGLASFRTRSDLAALLPFGKALYREQALAIFRLVTALAFLGILSLITPLAGDHQQAIRAVLFGYALFSLAILARVFVASALPPLFLAAVHASDVLWPSLICLFTGCAHSPFFLLFIFALLAGPYRRKAPETLAITLGSVLIVLGESMVAILPAFAYLHLDSGPLALGRFAVKASILMVAGGFLAYTTWWTQREQQAYATRAILQRIHAHAGIQTNLREVLPAILDIFEAKKVVLVLRNSSTWRVFEWGTQGDHLGFPVYRDVPASEEDRYFWPLPATSWSLACSRSGAKYDFAGLDRAGFRTRIPSGALTGKAIWPQPFRSLLTTTLQFGSEWTGRIFLIDAACAAGRDSCLRLLHQLADDVGPAVYNFYLWQHTSVRVRATERQRLARDLHDGVVQSLIATEMQLELVRRQSSSTVTSDALSEAQEVLRTEVRRLREQIDLLRSNALPRPVVPSLAQMLDNFQRETGIVTNFVPAVQETAIPRRVSHELVRIVEEALSNVRKHSGARRVDVHISSQDDVWEVVIQDDGRGFDFTGRLSLAQLEAARKGPRVIRERVHAVNGELALESWPNRGARLEIRLGAHA
jgi:signal transduction histidine kinase